jgi:hypothetical protein
MNQLKYDEFKAFYQYDKMYHDNIEVFLRDIVNTLKRKTETFKDDEERDECVIYRILVLEGMAYMELHEDNIERFKELIGDVKNILNDTLNKTLFDEEETMKGTNKSSSTPDKVIGETQLVVLLGGIMKETEHNYNLSLKAYEEWLEKKPEHYEKIMLKYSCEERDEPPPSPEKKKKKGKKKKGGRRR